MQTLAGMSAHSFPRGQPSSRIQFFPPELCKIRMGRKTGDSQRTTQVTVVPHQACTAQQGLGRARKTPSPSPTTSRSCLSPKGCCSSSRRVGTPTAPCWPAPAPGRGQQEPWASPKGSSASRAGAALAPAGAAAFLCPPVLLQLYLPRSPALGFPIHLAHPALQRVLLISPGKGA